MHWTNRLSQNNVESDLICRCKRKDFVERVPKGMSQNITCINTCMPEITDRVCGLVVRVPGYRSRGPGSIKFFWLLVGLERGPLSLVSTTKELLGRNSSGSGLESREYGHRDPPRWPSDNPLSSKVGTNFADKWRSLGQYSSLEN
jgi:hypothetical protein